jgi:hypothetical protein
MIAMAAWDYIDKGIVTDLEPSPNLRLDQA